MAAVNQNLAQEMLPTFQQVFQAAETDCILQERIVSFRAEGNDDFLYFRCQGLRPVRENRQAGE